MSGSIQNDGSHLFSNFEQPEFMKTGQGYETSIGEQKTKEGKTSYVLEVRYKGHDVTEQHPIKISLEGKDRDAAIPKFQQILTELNNAAGGEFQKLYSKSEREDMGGLQTFLNTNKFTKLNEDTSPLAKTETTYSPDKMDGRPVKSLKQGMQAVIGKIRTFFFNKTTSTEDRKTNFPSPATTDVYVKTNQQLNAASPRWTATKKEAVYKPIEGLSPNLEKIDKTLTETLNRGQRLVMTEDKKGVESRALSKIKSQIKSGAQTEAVRHILKAFANSAESPETQTQLYSKLREIKGYSEKLENHPDLKVMDLCIQSKIALSNPETFPTALAKFKEADVEWSKIPQDAKTEDGGLVHQKTLGLLMQIVESKIEGAKQAISSSQKENAESTSSEVGKIMRQCQSCPSLSSSNEISSKLMKASRLLIEAKLNISQDANSSLKSTGDYLNKIAEGDKGVQEKLLWGHQNNRELRSLASLIANKMGSATPAEQNNLLSFAQDYLNTGYSLPIHPQEKQQMLAGFIQIANKASDTEGLQKQAAALREEAGKQLTDLVSAYVKEQKGLPKKEGERKELFESLEEITEALGENKYSASIGSELLTLCPNPRDPQLLTAAPALPPGSAKYEGIPYDFKSMDAKDIYSDLASIVEEEFVSTNLSEFDRQGWSKDSTKEFATTLIQSIATFNAISGFLVDQITQTDEKATKEENQGRVSDAVHKTLELAELAMKDNNISLAMSIKSSLDNSSVNRLLKAPIYPKTEQEVEIRTKLDNLLATNSSNQQQRLALNAAVLAGEKAIPYTGVFLTDLTFIDDGNPDVLENGSVNEAKINYSIAPKKMMAAMQESIKGKETAGTENKPVLQQVLTQSFDAREAYKRSLQILPRQQTTSKA